MFTLIELLVVIAVILILAGATLAALGAARNKARLTHCLSNIRQIGQAVHMYANENQDLLPPCARLGPDLTYHLPSLRQALLPHLDDERIYHCPADAGDVCLFADVGTSYEWNTFLSGRTIDRTTLTIAGLKLAPPMVADGESFHGPRGRNYVFPDGRVVTTTDPLIE